MTDQTPEPQTVEQINERIAEIQRTLGPPVMTEADRKKLQDELDSLHEKLRQHHHSYARERAGIEARNRGGDPEAAMRDYDKRVAPAKATKETK